MRNRASVAAALFGWGLLTLAGCGGGSTTSTGGGGGATTPTVTVTPSSPSITTAQSLTVTVTVTGKSGTPSGSVTLTSGSYNSGSLALTSGSTQITIPAGKLPTGSDTLTAAYASTSSSYNNASGSGSVTVTSGSSLITPTVMVLPFPLSIVTTQSTMVTVMVNGGNGNPGPTGSVTLTSGSYNSGAVSLNAAEGQITIPAGSLVTGVDTLTATYAPDNNSSSTYNGASGTGEVNVAPFSGSITPLVTISPNPSNITSAESTTITISVSSGTGNPTPTGSVILTGPNYYSSGFVALTNGSAQITVHGNALGSGTVPLTATYGPDANGSSTYTSATANGSVIVSIGSLLTPTVTVTPNPPSITTAQSTTATVTVNGGTGDPAATGSVTLTCIQYTSSATTLVNGSAQITIPAGSIPAGNDTMTVIYTPDANSSSTYTSAMGTNTVTVTAPVLITPTVKVSANPKSVGTSGSSTVTATVTGGSRNPTPTGSITLTGGTYNSGPVTLASGSAQITVQGRSLAAGSNILTANYAPDANSSSTYTTATGSATVNVVAIVSFSANPNPIPYGSTSAQLTAVFSGGTGVVAPGNLSVTSGTPVTVSPTANITYTLTVTPSSGTAIAQTVTVNLASGVTINPANTGIAVTDQILGMNIAVWYDFTNNGTYTANNSPIVNAFKDAGIVALRWPGGSNADLYHWNRGAANPTNGTAPTAATCNNTYFNPNTNYLNFINDLEDAIPGGFDVALTANYGTNAACNGGGDPNEAANWVKYAYANGGTVSHVTVGNENFGHWEVDMHPIQWDPTTYANAIKGTTGYYDLIKAANPNTLVGVVVDANCTMANDCTDGWDSTVLSNAVGCNGAGTPCFDFVEYHYYAQHPGHETDTYLVQQAAQAFTANINTIKQELNTAGAPNTPIYVGEIGSATNVGKQSWSITQGLFAGQVLGEMMDDGVSRNTWYIGFGNCYGNQGNLSSSLYGWQDFGAFNVFSDGTGDIGYPNMSPCDYGGNGNTVGIMSPTAVAFNLFSNVAVNGEHVLTPSVAGDTTDIVAYAATHSGGTALVIINRNETTAEPVTITVAGKSTSPSVAWYWYDKEIYDYTNTSCDTAPTCTVDPNHDYTSIEWAGPESTSFHQQSLPLTVTLQPWSMNVFIIQ